MRHEHSRPFRGATRGNPAPERPARHGTVHTAVAATTQPKQPCGGCGKGKTPEQDLRDLFGPQPDLTPDLAEQLREELRRD